MQRKEIAEVINQHFKALSKLARKALRHYEEEVLHDFRVEFKKLRAFLVLLDTAGLKPRRRLKLFNSHLGLIRNIQLQQQLMQQFQAPDAYLQYLEQWKKELINETPGNIDFDEERDLLLKAIPARLSKAGIRKFIENKVNEIKAATDLHELRKLLKEILYNWPYIKHQAKGILYSRKELETLTEILGNYGDQCTALDLLQGHEGLGDIRAELERRKEQYEQEFVAAFRRGN